MDSKKWGIVRGNGKKVVFCFWGGVETPTFVADKRAGLSEILSARYARVYIRVSIVVAHPSEQLTKVISSSVSQTTHTLTLPLP